MSLPHYSKSPLERALFSHKMLIKLECSMKCTHIGFIEGIDTNKEQTLTITALGPISIKFR